MSVPQVKHSIEVSVVSGNDNNFYIEYRIPEALLDPNTKLRDNILQFRIEVSEKTTIASAVNEVLAEANVLLGSKLETMESVMNQLTEDTEAGLINYFKST